MRNCRYPLENDIKACARWQTQFLSYFETDRALKHVAYSHTRFLALMRDNPGQFLVPFYDIVLVWHPHIPRETTGDARDTSEFMRRFINHNEDADLKICVLSSFFVLDS